MKRDGYYILGKDRTMRALVDGELAHCPKCDEQVYVYISKRGNPYYCETPNKRDWHSRYCKVEIELHKIQPNYNDIMSELKKLVTRFDNLQVSLVTMEDRLVSRIFDKTIEELLKEK